MGVKLKIVSNKFLSFILAFASGLMMAIICFDLIPEALGKAGFEVAIVGIFLGIGVMIICELIVQNNVNKSNSGRSNLLKVGISVGIGLALHNIPEGLAIGSGFEASLRFRIFFGDCYCYT